MSLVNRIFGRQLQRVVLTEPRPNYTFRAFRDRQLYLFQKPQQICIQIHLICKNCVGRVVAGV